MYLKRMICRLMKGVVRVPTGGAMIISGQGGKQGKVQAFG